MKIISGDLLSLKGRRTVVVHQANCQSSNAAGLAAQLFRRYPWANIYRREPVRWPGEIFVDTPPPPDGDNDGADANGGVCDDDDDENIPPTVVALCAQFFPGRPVPTDTKTDSAELREKWFQECLRKLAEWTKRQHAGNGSSVADGNVEVGDDGGTATTNHGADTGGKVVPLTVAFPDGIGCGLARGNPHRYSKMISEFAEQLRGVANVVIVHRDGDPHFFSMS